MPKYRISGTVVGGKYLGEVEAANKEDAEALSFELEECDIILCHRCSRQCENAEIEHLQIELIKEIDEVPID